AGYGDCKDHVVLMQALLAARGIRAEGALIDWGARYADLPLWMPGQFNHAIIYLPDYDRYANPTDPFASFDALDRRLAGKLVVLASETGQVARTPASRPEANSYTVASRLLLSPDGSIEGEARLRMSPNLDGRLRAAVSGASSMRDLAERLLSGTAEGGFGDVAAGNPRDLEQPFGATITWRSPLGVTFQGTEAFLRVPAGPDIEPPARLRSKLSPSGTRRTPILADAGEYVWDTTIATASGLSIIRLPDDVTLQTSVGRYTARYRREAEGIRVLRQLVVEHDVVQPADYPELERLLLAPIEDSRTVLVVARGQDS
ncbi:MAG TPA: DUF3858 domain-containing protein, partial [Acetobacteraceae bacterium]